MFCTVIDMFFILFTLGYSAEKLIGTAVHMENGQRHGTISGLAHYVNDAFILVLVISLVLLALVTFFMIFFVIRYHWKRSPSAREVKEPLLLEIAWTVIPTVIVFIIFYVGWKNYLPLREVPENVMTVQAKARMWSWHFIYKNGVVSDTLRIPVGKPVKLLITSGDVLHSLFIPDFRIKEDAVPGMENFLWILPEKEGDYPIYCAEYCGLGHSSMNSKVIVVTGEEFSSWYTITGEKKKEITPRKTLDLLDDNGCLECHSIDGTRIEGPTFQGLFGKREIVITNGKEREITVDEAYLMKSILSPEADIVKDYPDIMPSFEGELSEEEIASIIQYLKTIK
jgi:cytochrome c oxidase subunit 2